MHDDHGLGGVAHAGDESGEREVTHDDVISRWTTHLAGQETAKVGQALPPHSPECAGCGPLNPAGLQLQAVRTATGVEAVHVFSKTQVGAPGIAHGGLVALAFDDLCGFALYTVGALAVTRSLTIDYRAPFRLHRPYTFRARVAEHEGRRLSIRADALDADGHEAGSAAATFVTVDLEHFNRSIL
ncbi:PaaI family thioesterase [Nocardioides sp. P86]|uniref:PaaI family thioesterase n=1 Tax=Nocardioides sp. P86 TaxID=2939569 RepID=UPI0020412B00|nr:PaaI family thioesterase [Nocardioides sp. P86]MCM3516154.1 PaaI family thioesterase [Nocardioides sp. P86]